MWKPIYGSEREYLNNCILALKKYYQDKGLIIIGLNDSQGVNITSTFFRKGLLDYLASSLKTKELTPTVINAFSLLMNKTEHIDYFLQNNLSLEEIKLSQIYSAVASFRKVMSDLHLPEFLGEVANVYRLVYSPKIGEEYIYLTDTLRQSAEPTLIYSSGVNNLMREVGNNPFAIKGDYDRRDITPNYNYTLEKSQDPKTLSTVFSGIGRNFDSILSVNDKTDIYTLGAYVPKALEQEEMNIFRELIQQYNERLQQLCKSYNITYIDTEMVGKEYNKSTANFHISTQGHNALANHIIECMYERKILFPQAETIEINDPLQITNDGPEGIRKEVYLDYINRMKNARNLELSYGQNREFKIAQEHTRETEVMKRVLTNSKTKR